MENGPSGTLLSCWYFDRHCVVSVDQFEEVSLSQHFKVLLYVSMDIPSDVVPLITLL